jgi:hypothetical protein
MPAEKRSLSPICSRRAWLDLQSRLRSAYSRDWRRVWQEKFFSDRPLFEDGTSGIPFLFDCHVHEKGVKATIDDCGLHQRMETDL